MLNNLSIRTKLFSIFIIPTLALVFLVVSSITTKLSVLNETQVLQSGLELSVKISSLVHEIQKEKGATAGFLGSKGTKFSALLADQKNLQT